MATTATTTALPSDRTGTLVIGSGIAGLTVALEAGRCTVVTAGALGEGTTRLAQGGLAAALAPDDDPARHAADTRAVAGGLADAEVAELVARAAPERIGWLARLGTGFDTGPDGRLALGREAGHSADRIVHARGDASGAAVMRALVAAVRERSDIEVVEHTRAVDLVRSGGRVAGVLLRGPSGAHRVLLADAVVLATGGIGRVYAHTTNPPGATGDGLAMAWRAGARIRDPEFVQFHPTALATGGDPLPLVTEALRGAGATLVDAEGTRYLAGVHPAAELAPRDVVARANWRAARHGPIYLDARRIGAELPERFPTVFALAREAGLDPRVDSLPVTPAQHYHMGGVATDRAGRTSLPGLFACGEVAATGLHGANRLASNSLVEGLVFGARVAAAIGASGPAPRRPRDLELPADARAVGGAEDDEAIAALRGVMWRAAGLERDAAGLADGLRELERLAPRLTAGPTGRNLAAVAEVVLRAAAARRETRGAHVRSDHPAPASGPARPTLVTPDPAPSVGLRTAPVPDRAHAQAAAS